MNRLGSNLTCKRICEAVRGSIYDSLKPSISKTGLRSVVSLVGGDGDGGETPANDSERPPIGNRKPNVPQDKDFLEMFKLGVESLKDDNRAEEKPRDSPKPSPPNPNPNPNPPENADEIFRKMKENGLIPNAVAMLDGLCKDGLVQDAMKLFGEMRQRGTIPEVVVYTAVVDGFCKARKLDDAVRIFRKMESNGIVPNAFSYNVLVKGLCQNERSEEGLAFCLEMLEAGHSPNVASFVMLVQGLCVEKGVEEAKGVIGKLREKGFVLNEKAVREFLDKKAGFSPAVWEAVFGKKPPQERLF